MTWEEAQGIALFECDREPPKGAMNSVERLCCNGSRGMGALEYQPEAGMRKEPGDKLSTSSLVDLAQDVIEEREGLHGERCPSSGILGQTAA